MAGSVRLFLIRHGETVDNVAQLYAGSRDSALTNHGYQQATRLGLHFKTLGLRFTHLYSSHLQRAARTAELIREAQLPSKGCSEPAQCVPEVTQLRILMEQDFGDLEGKRWSDMHAELQNKPGFVAVETKEAMGRRADTFLDEYLSSLLDEAISGTNAVIAIVSHGIFLSTLWKRLLRRLPTKSVSLSLDLQSAARPSLEHLGGWSNTGYLELHMTSDGNGLSSPILDVAPHPISKPDISQPLEFEPGNKIGTVDSPQAVAQDMSGSDARSSALAGDVAQVIDATLNTSAPLTPTKPRITASRIARGWTTAILIINGKDHLKGLKRTGGGVGSSRHDASQKGIESFFKRRKVD